MSNLMVLQAIRETRAELYDLKDKPDFEKAEAITRLATLYACLDVESLIQDITERKAA